MEENRAKVKKIKECNRNYRWSVFACVLGAAATTFALVEGIIVAANSTYTLGTRIGIGALFEIGTLGAGYITHVGIDLAKDISNKRKQLLKD